MNQRDVILETIEKLNYDYRVEMDEFEHTFALYDTGTYMAIMFDDIALWDDDSMREECKLCEKPGNHVCPDETVEGLLQCIRSRLRMLSNEIMDIANFIVLPSEE